MGERSQENVFVLMAAAIREAARLTARTLELARVETDGNIRALAGLAAKVLAIAVLVVSAFFVFLDAAVKMLAALIGLEAISALIVAAPFLGVAVILGLMGARRIALHNLEPWRSLREAERIAALAPSLAPSPGSALSRPAPSSR
ncbi:phage holin family protein [Methylobacterium gregans]|uniref:Phage holin family protein n=1 Tax=Methylobacterium gregans TaxID=374424 RepID=A0AA37HME4_9HYPH|nr:phage holin family protein [Methylobacterium gregans]MDQ0519968.1 hypothetical protein [Methylobacterium gregans]GJD77512.1 hypothetical protein NBEOAGPD_0717 [Methylobacterium gregans]GLS53912.1 hypothetical protein GCM10007886_20950 [Methylobacterium gregans]